MPAPLALLLAALYTLIMLGMSLFSLQSLLLALLYLRHRRSQPPCPPEPHTWPEVTVQLPLYNEAYVVERLLQSVCALDYPPDRLCIQVLDDSSDCTTALARRLVDCYRQRGLDISLYHRQDRRGYKAGALEAARPHARGELIAVFDADFAPPPDFLRRLVPYLVADPGLGMVQARWTHLNPHENPVTRGQALALDGHFVVIQTARSRGGLLFNFNGSAGVLRRSFIQAAGGWDGASLTEDLLLSYRAQLQGWRMLYLPEVLVPAEIPRTVAAYKRQQYRWARGGLQTLLLLAPAIWRAPLRLHLKALGCLHLASYLAHLFMLLYLLICLPLALAPGLALPSLRWMLPAALGPPLLVFLSQWGVYPDWRRRFLGFPFQVCLTVGMGLNNTLAALAALRGHPEPFRRTPKGRPQPGETAAGADYRLWLDWTVWGELALASYALAALLLALYQRPGLAPALLVIFIGTLWVAGMELWEARRGA